MPDAKKTIAYLSMEYALEENFPIYAGGLGVLAADIFTQASLDNLNFLAFGLFYYRGFHAHLDQDDKDLDPSSVGFQKLTDHVGQILNLSIPLGESEVFVQVWTKKKGAAQIFLFDTNILANHTGLRDIGKFLYGPDTQTMFEQQIILAFATLKLIKFLGLKVDIFHLNEGHTALVLLALALDHRADNPQMSLHECLDVVKNQAVGTKHTILTGGGLHVTLDELNTSLGHLLTSKNIPTVDLFNLGTHETHPNSFSTTQFLLRFTIRGSAVSAAHAAAEKKLHVHSNLIPITNGICQARWQNPQLESLLNSPEQFWQQHIANKKDTFAYLQTLTPHRLDPSVLTIVWARRFASYKRPELLFSNIDALSKLTRLMPAVQFIIAGQTNPTDTEAAELASEIKTQIDKMQFSGRVLFLTQYSLTLARKLVAGADVWLNTPLPGFEASGTSGMKAGINGLLEFSTADGWVAEIDWTNIGWILFESDIKTQLYNILESEIIPLYYQIDGGQYPPKWVERMQKTIAIIKQNYTTSRLLADYYSKLYFPKPQLGV